MAITNRPNVLIESWSDKQDWVWVTAWEELVPLSEERAESVLGNYGHHTQIESLRPSGRKVIVFW